MTPRALDGGATCRLTLAVLQRWLSHASLQVMQISLGMSPWVLIRSTVLRCLSQHAMTPSHAALGWLLAQPGIIAIPKTGNRRRLLENLQAIERPLSAPQAAELCALFPAPATPQPLAML